MSTVLRSRMFDALLVAFVALAMLSSCASAGQPLSPANTAEVANEPAKTAPAPVKRDKLKVAYAAISGSQAVLWVTKEKGLFEKHGLDVEILYISGGSKATQALIGGDVGIMQGAGPEVVSVSLAGTEMITILGVVNVLPYSVMAVPAIKKPQDLKGKSMAVSRFGSSTDFAGRFALRKWGLEPEKDVAVIQAGGVPEVLAMMQAGGTQAGVLSSPTTATARKLSYTELGDLSKLDLAYQAACVAALRSFVEANPEIVRKFARAYVEGIKVYKTEPAFVKSVIGNYAKLDDKDILDDTYNFYVDKVEKVPYPTVAGYRTILEELAPSEPKARTADPNKFIEGRFVKELEDSGFIKGLYDQK